METAYRREEIVSSSKASKHLGEVLNEAKRKGRIVLSRNNRLEAVILPIEEYEGIVDDLDHLLTALEIQERKASSTATVAFSARCFLTALEIQERKARDHGKRVAWETLKAKHGL